MQDASKLFEKIAKCKDIKELYETGDISDNNIGNTINYDLKLDTLKLFKVECKLDEIVKSKDNYILADALDFNVSYGGDLLASNFIYFGLKEIYTKRFSTNDVLLTKIQYKSIKLHILRMLHHLYNLRFANKKRIFRYSYVDALPDNIIDKNTIKKQITEASLSECFVA